MFGFFLIHIQSGECEHSDVSPHAEKESADKAQTTKDLESKGIPSLLHFLFVLCDRFVTFNVQSASTTTITTTTMTDASMQVLTVTLNMGNALLITTFLPSNPTYVQYVYLGVAD